MGGSRARLQRPQRASGGRSRYLGQGTLKSAFASRNRVSFAVNPIASR